MLRALGLAMMALTACAPLEKRDSAIEDSERVSVARDVISNYPGWRTEWICVGRNLPKSNEFLAVSFQMNETSGVYRLNVGPIVVDDQKKVSSRISTLEVEMRPPSERNTPGVTSYYSRKQLQPNTLREPLAVYEAPRSYLYLHVNKIGSKPLGIDCANGRIDRDL